MVNIKEAINCIENYNFKYSMKKLKVEEGLGKVLAQDIYSKINVPHFNKSAMDGYALKREDIEANILEFTIKDIIYAGDKKNIEINTGECVRIMTGAKVPNDCDIVIMQELAQEEGDIVKLSIPKTKLNDNICKIGEDLQENQLVFEKNTLLDATRLAVLTSIGYEEVEIFDINILVITTGDEVLGSTVEGNESSLVNIYSNNNYIFNSNKTYLMNRLRELNVFNIKHVHLGDNRLELEATINNINQYDLVISTGAISVGEKDIIRKYIYENKCNIIFDKINIMPGGPCVFWEIKNIPILSLAGSPFANFVTFELLCTTFISKFLNNPKLKYKMVKRILQDEWNKPIKKMRFVKVYVDGNNCYLVSKNHKASALYEMTRCNALMLIEPRVEMIYKGSEVSIIKLGGKYE